MKKRNDISKTDAAFRQWLAGSADAREERQLYAQSDDDSFLADAMEGVEAFPEGDHAARVTRLKGRLRRRTAKNRGIIVFFRSAAAVLVVGLMAGLGWYIWNDDSPTLADKAAGEEQAAPAENPPATSDDIAGIQPALRPPVATQDRIPGAPKAAAPQRSTEIQADAIESIATRTPAVTAAAPAKTDDSVAGLPAAESAQVTRIAATETAMPKPAPEREAALKDSDTAAPGRPAAAAPATTLPAERLLSGKVTGPNGEPLIGASIMLQSTQKGAVTDWGGNFKLAVPANMESGKLLISYTGYQAKTAEFGKSGEVQVILTEDMNALSEVVVTGAGARKESKKMAAFSAATGDVQPKGGFEALEAFMKKNKKQPEAAQRDQTMGFVEISFSVSAQGRLSDFRVLQPLGDFYDTEAIRLLKAGPKWENKSGKANTQTYRVYFP
ncbi:MAG: carboxypeptidase-like regulatory domain-containing protein [Saprospiraceae bacterium]|nr:carboxypeptidase-like regulatory domain-containing protein [Saprospiraceae bacterium]